MKELLQIIEQLDEINRLVIEKDNLIDQMQFIIQLVSQLMNDPQFVQSVVYLDLRAKYLSKIDDYLKKINETPVVTIEPQNLPTPAYAPSDEKKKRPTRDDVKAPLTTNIYTAPSCRTKYSRKKVEVSQGGETPINPPREGDEGTSSLQEYFSFEFQGQIYYLSPQEENQQHTIYDEGLSTAGSLKGSTVTLLVKNSETGLLQTVTRTLRTVEKMDQPRLFGSYVLEGLAGGSGATASLDQS
jgi:hypothetical protein